MVLHVDVRKLVEGSIIETNRVEYRASGNPQKVLHTICAFANDYEETHGSYIVIGVSETNGILDTVVGVNEWEISTELGYSKITKVVRTCIGSLMDEEMVRYLYPDNPRDPRQKICLRK